MVGFGSQMRNAGLEQGYQQSSGTETSGYGNNSAPYERQQTTSSSEKTGGTTSSDQSRGTTAEQFDQAVKKQTSGNGPECVPTENMGGPEGGGDIRDYGNGGA